LKTHKAIIVFFFFSIKIKNIYIKLQNFPLFLSFSRPKKVRILKEPGSIQFETVQNEPVFAIKNGQLKCPLVFSLTFTIKNIINLMID